MTEHEPAARPDSGSAAPGDGPPLPTFTHTGFRYVLGHDERSYAIWDRAAPEEPAERFDPTPEGWAAAWRRFTGLEPRAETLGQDAKLTDARPINLVRALRVPAIVASVLLAAHIGLAIAQVVLSVSEVQAIERIRSGRDPIRILEEHDDRDATFTNISGLLSLAAAAAWFTWQYRARLNLDGLGVRNLQISPGWGIGWWFVPFANLVMPYRAVNEIYKASDPEADLYRWGLGRSDPLIAAWWLTWIGGFAGGIVVGAVFASNFEGSGPALGGLSLDDRAFLAWAAIGMAVLSSISAVLAMLVVRRVSARQTAKLARGGAAPAVPGTVEPGPPTFTHTGFRFVLGHDALGYAIWERERPGEPVHRWGRDPESWTAAWDRFTSLEPRGAALERPFVPGSGPAAAQGAAGTARTTLVLGIVAAATGVFFLGVLFGPLALLIGATGWRDAQRSSNPERDRDRIRTGMILGGVGTVLSVIVIVIAANLDSSNF